jgi:MraZ protein
MTSFLGRYTHTLDAKGRLSIPSKFRKATGEIFVLTLGLDGCLFFYPREEWQRVESELRGLSFTSRKTRFFKREIASRADEVSVDKHGRIVIPQELRELVGLEKDVLVIGAIERVEFWDPKRHQKYKEEFGLSYEEVAETLWENPGDLTGKGGEG